jgi:hypothetical protein
VSREEEIIEIRLSRPANETSQVKLLERDVYVQFLEIRRLRDENEVLKKKLEAIKTFIDA